MTAKLNLALALALLLSAQVQAAEIEIGGGVSVFHTRECGTWIDCRADLRTDRDFRSWGYQLGAKWYEHSPVSIRASYVNLGHFYANTTWVADANVNHNPLNCSGDPGDCRHESGISGTSYGGSLGPVFNFNLLGAKQELEFGGFVFRSNQKTNICPIDGQAEQCFTYNRQYGIHKTWYFGGGLGQGNWMLNYRIYHDIFEQGKAGTVQGQGGDVGITGGATQTVFLTYKF